LTQLVNSLPTKLAGRNDPLEILRILKPLAWESVFQSLAGLAMKFDKTNRPIPPWAIDALRGPMEDRFGEEVVAEKLAGLARSMGVLMEMTLEQIKEMEAPSGSPS
jgi:hypothetical protein